jgi:O-antigen ligase
MLFRLAIRKLPITAALGPSFWPFVYVVSCVAISTIYGRVFLGHQFAISEARNQIVWLLIPLMAIYVDSPKRFQLLLRATLFAAIVISIYLVTQSVFNIDIMGNRVESLDNRGNQDVIRSTAGGGVYLIAFATMYFLGMGISRRIPLLLVFMSVLVLVAGLAVTFGRGVWVATACGLLLASVLNRGFIGGIKTSIVGGVILMLFLAGTVVVKPRVAEALVDRVTGLATEFERGASFGDRLTENADAIKAIRNHPLLGVGMGGEYVVTVRTFDVDGRYIHNSYLFFPLKMGMIAAAVPFTFMLFFIGIYRGWFAKLSVQSRTVPAAIAGAFFVPMVTSVTQPEWAAPQGIAAISLLFMLAWLYRRLNIASTSESLEGAAKPHVQASRPGRTATHASTIASNAHAHRPTK